jgi:glycosyltransferase involved in cell wall biosynthesis
MELSAIPDAKGHRAARVGPQDGGAQNLAAPAQKRAMILGYLTYRGDARVKRQVKTLAAAGYAVDVICLAEDMGEVRGAANLIGIAVPHYRGDNRLRYVGAYATFFLKAAWTAARLAARHRYDVAIVCNMPDFIVACALGPKLGGARIVLDVHDPLPELYRVKFGRPAGCLGERLLMAEERSSAWFVDRVLATHDLHLMRLARAGIPRHKLRVVLNAPNPELFPYSQDPLRRDGGFRLVYHGTISARLGIDVAIRATALARARIPQIQLRLIGDGEAVEECKRLSGALGVDDIVRFEAPVPVEKIAPLLHRCSAGIVPNRDNAATQIMLPVKLMEYAMLGVPAVAARLGPITQYFDERAVEFFEPENPADLAAAIVRLYEDPGRCARLAAQANRVAVKLSGRWSENYLEAIAPPTIALAQAASGDTRRRTETARRTE